LSKVLNQPYVIETTSFEIYMTTESDLTYRNPYQEITSDFIVDTKQQRPGDMKGRVTAQNTLVQTYSSLDFLLQPTMDLSADSYIILNIPNTLEFQLPSCTVTNIKGAFSQFMSCSRDGQRVTLYQPFSSPFYANQSAPLEMTIEEFLMPTSIREIGNI
jgi:hypothetical protein